MLKASELAAKAFTSADEHKRTATTLRRLSGGIGAQRSNALELNEKEKAVLSSAMQLLDRMAEVAAQASLMRKKVQVVAEARRAAIKVTCASTFGTLSTVAGKVALIGAVQSYSLRGNAEAWATDKYMLASVFRDALDGLVWSLAEGDVDKPVDEVVAQAWEKFLKGRADIEDKHARVIVALQRLLGEQSASN